MTDDRSAARAPWWLASTAVTVAVSLGLSTGLSRRGGPPSEPWTALVRAGDELVAGRPAAGLGGRSLTARKAYLLAFHEAQDRSDLEHVLAVADRLDAAGEDDLAAHVRRAAAALVDALPE